MNKLERLQLAGIIVEPLSTVVILKTGRGVQAYVVTTTFSMTTLGRTRLCKLTLNKAAL
jgi:hypothetical protein